MCLEEPKKNTNWFSRFPNNIMQMDASLSELGSNFITVIVLHYMHVAPMNKYKVD